MTEDPEDRPHNPPHWTIETNVEESIPGDSSVPDDSEPDQPPLHVPSTLDNL